ncbi:MULTISPECIES: SDR family oxidoreductase [unclassified Nocardioides]|uniref:SDR family NAD(P)-dependent oxidoreductase n=1 Tax=unclassified Nocardioides TaxID=2615069 RepID=UPI00115146FD|nr:MULTISPECIES: SDR family NAD(P)-dependent oxidoreductase [unclassified Nocardioides]TQK69376.1 short-subunit dehydrogenase [Nocardioides sp. SLBN-35]WGY01325.1 SDR family NAD(P)-dependent oxidoreductase [Nocardioides sp. QY071]
MKDFNGKVVVITGAGAGIGRELAVQLAREGARLAVSGRSIANVEETAELCRKAGAEARAYEVDVTDRNAVIKHADEVVADFGKVNVVINNAGVSLVASVDEVSWDDLDWIVNINFWGVVHGTKAFLPHVIASGDGHIANISSMFGLVACPTQSGYNATKFAVRAFTDSLRQEMRMYEHKVGVSSVHPGSIRTDIAKKARAGGDRDVAQLAANFDRIAKMTVEECADIIIKGIRKDKAQILCGNDAKFMAVLPRVMGPGYQKVITALFKKDVK